jgi:hypothetical protein
MIIIPLNIFYDPKEGIEYLNFLNQFPHLRWTFKDLRKDEQHQRGKQYNSPNHYVDLMYFWTLRGCENDPWRPTKLNSFFSGSDDKYVNTELVDGLAKKLLEMFPKMGSMHVGGHPPGTKLELHTDDEDFFRVHVPLITNKQAYFFGEDKEKHYLEPGRLYILETNKEHGTVNYGEDDRVHILFKMPRNLMQDTINLSGRL